MSRRIVVAGGTGFVGRSLVRRLVQDGCEVTVLTRRVGVADGDLPVRCRLRTWDPERPLEADVLRGIDTVVNLAGEGIADGRWTADRKHGIRESRVRTTRGLVHAMAKLEGAARPRTFISASAVGYYGERGGEELDETSSPGGDFLADVCRVWEGEAFVAATLDVRTAVLRFGVVLGREGGALGRMLPPFRLGLGGRLGSGEQWMSCIHLDDLVDLIRFVMDRSDAAGVLNAVAPTPVTNRVFTTVLAKTLGKPALFPVPAVALRVLFGEMSVVLLGSQRVFPRAAERLGFVFRHGDLAEALRDVCGDTAREIECEQWLPYDPAEVFAFFSDPSNLGRITPPFVGFQLLGSSTPELRADTRLDYRLRLHGIPVRWQSQIEEWTPGRRFVDAQVKGPYRRWRHTHEFEPWDGGTIVRDRVRYELPLGAIGDLVAGRWVARDVASIFAFRKARLAELLASGSTVGDTARAG